MIPLFKSYCPEHETVDYIRNVIRSGYMAEGATVKKFERALAEFYGVDEVMCTNSCTSALQIAYRCAGIKSGDEVITTPLTCVATNIPLLQIGARIVWADVDRVSGMITADEIERLISTKTKAIVVIHKEGDVFERSKIREVANHYRIPVIEDCAHVLKSTEGKKPVPEGADFACFSYQAIKHLNTGDGGALYCAPRYRDLAKRFKWFGIDRDSRNSNQWLEDIKMDGYKMNMNEITAGIGLAQLECMQNKWRKNQENGSYLDSLFLERLPFVMTSFDRKVNKSSYWAYPVRVGNRAEVVKRLEEAGIASRQIHPRNDTLTVFKDFADRKLPNVAKFNEDELCLPVGWWVDTPSLDLMCSIMIKYAVNADD